MTLGQTALLGIVQGLTEFLPVSSDGHLTLIQAAMKLEDSSLAMEIALHLGTFGSLIVFFGKDLLAMARGFFAPAGPVRDAERRRVLLIALVTVPTGIVGFALKRTVEGLTTSYGAAGAGFMITAVFLAVGEWASRRRELRPLERAPLWHTQVLGVVQGAAVWPGWSRSGSTIGTALALGWKWEDAGPFCFLMSIPAIAGATLLDAKQILAISPAVLAVGTVVSFLTGCAALFILMKFLRARLLWPFAVYCAGLGIFALCRAA